MSKAHTDPLCMVANTRVHVPSIDYSQEKKQAAIAALPRTVPAKSKLTFTLSYIIIYVKGNTYKNCT